MFYLATAFEQQITCWDFSSLDQTPIATVIEPNGLMAIMYFFAPSSSCSITVGSPCTTITCQSG